MDQGPSRIKADQGWCPDSFPIMQAPPNLVKAFGALTPTTGSLMWYCHVEAEVPGNTETMRLNSSQFGTGSVISTVPLLTSTPRPSNKPMGPAHGHLSPRFRMGASPCLQQMW